MATRKLSKSSKEKEKETDKCTICSKLAGDNDNGIQCEIC